jgi:uncharacterized protein (TIGR03067 family)
MRRYAIAAVVFAAVVGTVIADDNEKARKALNGSYNVKSMSKGGMDLPEDSVKTFEEFAIKDGKITMKIKDEAKGAKFTLDPKQKPAHIDLTPSDGPNADKTMKGIYKLEKGTLTIAFDDEQGGRPKDFDDKTESVIKIVLEKKGEK